MTILQSGVTLPISVAAGNSLVIKELTGTATVTGSTAPREDASVRIGAGFFVYGPQVSQATLSISTTGLCDYQVVAGDPTPANQPLLFDPGNPPTSGPTLSGDGAGAVGSAVGGLRNGSSANAFPGGFLSQSYVDPNETLQAAVDKAPSSASLVQSYTTGITDLTSGFYAIVLPSRPRALYASADLITENAYAFASNTALANPEIWAGAGRFWKWDAANSRAIIYNTGAAVTQVTCAAFHAVVAIDRNQYGSVNLRPGIVIVGNGTETTKLVNTTRNTMVAPTGTMYATVVSSSYSGLSGVTVESVPALSYENNGGPAPGVGGGNVALALPLLSSSDCFTVQDCKIVIPEGHVNLIGYNIAVFFGTSNVQGFRSKNVQFLDTPIIALSPVDAIETYSFNFGGLVYFYRCPISGGVFIDGNLNTFSFIDGYISNRSSRNPGEVLSNSLYSFPINLGSNAVFPGQDAEIILINNPVSGFLPKNVAALTPGATTYGFYKATADTCAVKIINAPIYADRLFTVGDGVALTSAFTKYFQSQASAVPPAEVTTTVSAASSGFSLTQVSALVPKVQARLVYATQSATPKNFGIFNILYEDLLKRGAAKITVRGSTAANANTKTLKAQSGVSATLAGVVLADVAGATFSGAYNNQSFEFTADITVSALVVSIKGQMLIGTTLTPFVAKRSIADSQYLQIVLNATGVATNDISVDYQSVEIAG